jgi:predicted AlkP superfamily pyrophosphatase or phosphodiesterase
MKKLLWIAIIVFFEFSTAQERPKLVVGIVIDQMKMEYLYRFQSDFTSNGFKRLIEQGYSFENAHFNYMPTYTAPGHASVYTGATPSLHGIISNEWFHRTLKKQVYCTDDATVSTLVPGSEIEGKMSPRNLQSTTITDELKLSTNFKGKVIGISIKDRGAILPAGHFADWAFWYCKTGEFISSSYYGTSLPSWVDEFNKEKNYLKYANKGWGLLKSKETYNESFPDDNPYEGKLYQKTPFFPYNTKEMVEKNDAGVLRISPYGNNLVNDLAKRAIEKENLGKDDVTDFLALSFSSTDYIGHTFGPRSIEIQDTYLRLDYLVFLTADHGGAENVTHLKDNKYQVNNINFKTIESDLKEFSRTTFGEDLLLKYDSFNVFFDKDLLNAKGLELTNVKQVFKNYLYAKDYIKRVYTEEEILASTGNDVLLDFVSKGYDPTQNGELYMVFKPGYIEYSLIGTSHGSPYTYDTHVPMIFFGWHIKKGKTNDRKEITQIAPTVTQLLKITMPNSTKGEVLTEIVDAK